MVYLQHIYNNRSGWPSGRAQALWSKGCRFKSHSGQNFFFLYPRTFLPPLAWIWILSIQMFLVPLPSPKPRGWGVGAAGLVEILNVESTLRISTNVEDLNVGWENLVDSTFIFNVESTLIQRWERLRFQRWINVESTLKCPLGYA